MKRLDRNLIFDSAHVQNNLAKKSIGGGIITMTSHGIQFAIATLGTMILARVLIPDDFGLNGMMMVVIGFAEIFKEAGLSTATIQKDRISHEQISTLFWINIFISFLLCLCALAISPIVSEFFGRSEIASMTAVSSISFVLAGFGIQHLALIRRHMRFEILAVIKIASQLTYVTVAVILALIGWGYWALIWGTIAMAGSQSLLTLYFCPWWPGRMTRGAGVRDMVNFGSHLTIFNFVHFISQNMGQVILGKLGGAATVGYYTKAKGLLMTPLAQFYSPLSAVMTPVLSKLQNKPDQYRRYYYSLILLLGFVTMPMACLMLLYSNEIIYLLLGPGWETSARIFQIFAWFAVIYPVAATRGLVMVTLGKTLQYTYFGFFFSLTNIVGMVIGSHWGAIGLAAGFVIANYITLIPSLFFCFKGTPVTSFGFMKICILPLFASLFCAFFVHYFDSFFTFEPILKKTFGAILYCITYSIISFMIFKTRYKEEFALMRNHLVSIVSKSAKSEKSY